MATKKQKRAAALAKREKFLAEVKADGLLSQEWDHEQQKLRREATKNAYREINERHQEILNHHTADVVSRVRDIQHSQLMMEPTKEQVDDLARAIYLGLGG